MVHCYDRNSTEASDKPLFLLMRSLQLVVPRADGSDWPPSLEFNEHEKSDAYQWLFAAGAYTRMAPPPPSLAGGAAAAEEETTPRHFCYTPQLTGHVLNSIGAAFARQGV